MVAVALSTIFSLALISACLAGIAAMLTQYRAKILESLAGPVADQHVAVRHTPRAATATVRKAA